MQNQNVLNISDSQLQIINMALQLFSCKAFRLNETLVLRRQIVEEQERRIGRENGWLSVVSAAVADEPYQQARRRASRAA